MYGRRLRRCVGIAAAVDADDRRVRAAQLEQHFRLGEHVLETAVQVGLVQRLHHHVLFHVWIAAEEGGAEAAGAEDALRRIVVQRKRGQSPSSAAAFSTAARASSQ